MNELVRVKICGLTTLDMVEVAVDAGAHAIGLVLSESPRRVDARRAAELFAAIPQGVERIAVLRRPGAAERALLAALSWDGVQVDAEHARETPLPSGAFLLPSFRDGPDVLERMRSFGSLPSAPDSLRGSFLLDGPLGGGLGIEADRERARRVGATDGLRLVLAGGLTPETVADLVRVVRPFAVDVSSGVERSPGVKDAARIRDFLAAVRDSSPANR